VCRPEREKHDDDDDDDDVVEAPWQKKEPRDTLLEKILATSHGRRRKRNDGREREREREREKEKKGRERRGLLGQRSRPIIIPAGRFIFNRTFLKCRVITRRRQRLRVNLSR